MERKRAGKRRMIVDSSSSSEDESFVLSTTSAALLAPPHPSAEDLLSASQTQQLKTPARDGAFNEDFGGQVVHYGAQRVDNRVLSGMLLLLYRPLCPPCISILHSHIDNPLLPFTPPYFLSCTPTYPLPSPEIELSPPSLALS